MENKADSFSIALVPKTGLVCSYLRRVHMEAEFLNFDMTLLSASFFTKCLNEPRSAIF